MGMTLISIGRIAATGTAVIFRNNTCRIFSPNKKLLGEISISGGLYRVRHSPEEFAAKANEAITIEQLHRILGHIAPEAAREAVRKGLVTGITIDESSPITVCESCEHAKMTRKAIRREREGERAAAIGDEVHSDLWGPAPVETIKRRRYYVEFTDD
ncbi:hypothetical protein BDW22DRAFT_1300633, partial [Trametopsis cervina]